MKMKKNLIALMICICVAAVGIGSVPVAAKTEGTYMTRYKRLVKESKKKFQYDGTQYEMNATSVKEYKFWDKELKKVYKKELKLISKKKAKKLKKLQKSWKEKRVKYSQKSAKKYNGGSMYVMVYNNAYTKYTKKRIKWLIKNYKDVGNF